MSYRLQEACSLIDAPINVLKDCYFDSLYLVGKPYPAEELTLSYLTGRSFVDAFLSYDISGVICTDEIAEVLKERGYEGGVAVTDKPKVAFFSIHNHYASEKVYAVSSISPEAKINPTARIADHGVSIGSNSVIMANVVIKEGTTIGDHCIIREGCVIGSPAFYYFGDEDSKTLVESSGGVVIGNNVELHTNVTVEKGAMGGNTVIGDNTKIDNVSLIGHDSQIGRNVTMAASATLAGGVSLGDNSFLGVGVTIAPYVKCGENTKLSAGAVATKNIPDNMHASGNFAVAHDKYLRFIKSLID